MARISDVERTLTLPPQAPTDIRASHNKYKGVVQFVEHSERREAWLEIDDEHAWVLRDME